MNACCVSFMHWLDVQAEPSDKQGGPQKELPRSPAAATDASALEPSPRALSCSAMAGVAGAWPTAPRQPRLGTARRSSYASPASDSSLPAVKPSAAAPARGLPPGSALLPELAHAKQPRQPPAALAASSNNRAAQQSNGLGPPSGCPLQVARTNSFSARRDSISGLQAAPGASAASLLDELGQKRTALPGRSSPPSAALVEGPQQPHPRADAEAVSRPRAPRTTPPALEVDLQVTLQLRAARARRSSYDCGTDAVPTINTAALTRRSSACQGLGSGERRCIPGLRVTFKLPALPNAEPPAPAAGSASVEANQGLPAVHAPSMANLMITDDACAACQ